MVSLEFSKSSKTCAFRGEYSSGLNFLISRLFGLFAKINARQILL